MLSSPKLTLHICSSFADIVDLTKSDTCFEDPAFSSASGKVALVADYNRTANGCLIEERFRVMEVRKQKVMLLQIANFHLLGAVI